MNQPSKAEGFAAVRTTWIHHNNIVLVLAVEFGNEVSHILQCERFPKCEDFKLIHIIDVYEY